MTKFIKKIILYFILLGIISILYVLVIYYNPYLVDNFYYRFTTNKAKSLILGTSRSAQGIKPSIINKIIPHTDNKIINHSFAIGPSSYGPNYYKEIYNKLDTSSTSGLFILSVDPWSLTVKKTNINDDTLDFFEVKGKLFVGNLKSCSSNPNYEYLWEYWGNKYSIFENVFKHLINYHGILELHKDGWLEVNIKMDSTSVQDRILSSTNEYKEKAKTLKLSNTRFLYLEKIITYLKNRGEIYFVRLPVSLGMAEIEKTYFPEFDYKIIEFSEKCNIKYINFFEDSGEYKTIDTHHLWREESERISNQICDSILEYRKSNHYIEN